MNSSYQKVLLKMKLRLHYKDKNELIYNILTLGLYFFAHELTNITVGAFYFESNKEELREALLEDPFSNYTELLKYIKNIMSDNFRYVKRKSIRYKEDMKDFEYLIKGMKDLNGDLFIPTNFKELTKNKKQKELAKSFDKFWSQFNSIIKNN